MYRIMDTGAADGPLRRLNKLKIYPKSIYGRFIERLKKAS